MDTILKQPTHFAVTGTYPEPVAFGTTPVAPVFRFRREDREQANQRLRQTNLPHANVDLDMIE